MCIAIYKPADRTLTKKTLQTCWTGNPDGAGFMYVNGKGIVIEKELSSFKAFWIAYQLAMKGPAKGREVVLHFRISTSGKIDLENCHPHVVNEGMAFCHNGIINYRMKDDSPTSDTILFKNAILKGLPDGFLNNPSIVKLLEDYIESSKMIFLTVSGEVTILNESKGEWYDGVWFSNDGHRTRPAYNFSGAPFGGKPGIDFYRDSWEGDLHSLSDDSKSRKNEAIINTYCIECGMGLNLKDDDQFELSLCSTCLYEAGYYSPAEHKLTGV